MDSWPQLPYEGWSDTLDTLHMWAQIIGKVKLKLTPWTNHSWHVTFAVTSAGLTTGPIPSGRHCIEICFDFVRHRLEVLNEIGEQRTIELAPMTVADFYTRTMSALAELGCPVRINCRPNEVVDPIRFDEDRTHKSYDADAVTRFHQALLQADRLLKLFRADFIGKCSPVHFFWGGMDLAVTRFSGRRAPEHPGGIPNMPDWITREAYSHQVSSAGFWPGNAMFPHPAFYSYAYPAPEGFGDSLVLPDEAYFDPTLGEFILPYDTVRASSDPDEMVLEFLRTTYDAAANLAHWDRDALERPAAHLA